MRNRIFWIVAIAVVATLGVVWLTQRFPGALDSRSGQVRLVANLGWLALLVSSLVISFRARPLRRSLVISLSHPVMHDADPSGPQAVI